MTIVVGYLPSPQGEAALDQAIIEAQRAQARLVVVNSSKGDALVDDRLIDAREFHLLEEQLTSAGLDFWIERSTQGRDAADEILRVAQAQRAQLIVIGLRKRSTVGKFIMGSTAQRILMQSGCPVLSVKAGNAW
ncbi:universal stress protein UspA [Arthrobacter sp. MYb224]|uniref:universal stress protein n=1 Tax=Arthrobacter sp. MYb224 TaxID=1848600 RepID=UPI000CFC4DA7|nr:universal stress protein [Arthrobacter sp. MYb224]PQZ96579.1 universal stress protein UspA [Arthrobacter sp. MYb224]